MKNFEAVCHLYPTAVFSMVDDDVNKITWVGETFPIPTEEQLANAIAEIEASKAQEAADKEAKKASAIAKLSALGLTADEISALY
jgi:hypothetical protein